MKSSDLLQMLESHTTNQAVINPESKKAKFASLGKSSLIIRVICCDVFWVFGRIECDCED